MNLKDILATIQKDLRITPYKGCWYFSERDMEAILKIAFDAGAESVTIGVESEVKVDSAKKRKV